MAEDSNAKDADKEDLDALDDGIERDYFLQALTNVVNRTGLEMGVTLTVGGTLVCGTMISGKTYYDGLYSLLSENIDNEDVLSFFKTLIDIPSANYVYDPEDTRPFNIVYIHLKDARFVGPDGNYIPDTGGTLWRGRISQVAGFHFGIFGPLYK